MFWNGSASLLFENLPRTGENRGRHGGRRPPRTVSARDFTEMAEDKEAAAQFVPQEYKDLWM